MTKKTVEGDGFTITFDLPLILMDRGGIEMYCAPYEPHVFHCDTVILNNDKRERVAVLSNMNVMLMHGRNNEITQVSSKNPNIKISEIIEKAEGAMKGKKIDVLAICNRNSGKINISRREDYKRIYALDSRVSVTLTKDKQTGNTTIQLGIEDKGGYFANIDEVKGQQLMKEAVLGSLRPKKSS